MTSKITQPKERYSTRKAIDKLVKELNMPHENWMQDWPYEIADSSQIDRYINYYQTITDEDEKLLLMRAILQATEEQDSQELLLKYWDTIHHFLNEDFHIHEYTIYYWCCFDNDDLEDCWKITSLMRNLFIKKQNLASYL